MFLLMGSHLFDPALLQLFKQKTFVMIEDYGLCTHFRYHRQKLIFFLEAMRNHRDLLRAQGFRVIYEEIELGQKPLEFFERLEKIVKREKNSEITSFVIEDKFFRDDLRDFCKQLKLSWHVIDSPLFLNTQIDIEQAISSKRPFMKTFYEKERVKRKILVTKENIPLGGKFSFDSENRSKLPKNFLVPSLPTFSSNPHRSDVVALVKKHFTSHPGSLDAWLPSTREQAKESLKRFLNERLKHFGPYEDAIEEKHPFLFHSVISPLLNCGLLTPEEVIEQSLQLTDSVPINSLEGFIRQIMGWREFIRGIYEKYSTEEESRNFFKHERKLTAAWYEGTTGIIPLDHAIKKAWNYGYCHHIERLMILSNCMLLSEIAPSEVHRWFMEMFIDSADWVMGPNVYGMGQFSDGGLFATKPYIGASNYLLKMSSFKRGDWCDVLDGLYWRFIDKHRHFFSGQMRLSMMPKILDRMDSHRKKMLFLRAEQFIDQHTTL
jgi:deoxyribodipyrimidine photolyase-related protein